MRITHVRVGLVSVLALVLSLTATTARADDDEWIAPVFRNQANPANADYLGLGTLRDYYAITMDWITVQLGHNVLIQSFEDGSVALRAIEPITGALGVPCSMGEMFLVDPTPCRTNPAGYCDVAY